MIRQQRRSGPSAEVDRRASRGTLAFRFSSTIERKIVRKAGQAVGDFRMIEDGDHILAAVSGGKDSLSMLEVLRILRRRSPIRFRVTAVTVHGGYPGFSTDRLEEHYRTLDIPYRIEHVPIKQILEEKLENRATPCSLCSRIRRGALYSLAPDIGCNKIALGHHLDDLIETLLLNLFYSGRLRSMGPRFRSDDGRNIVIRPLCYVPESWLIAYSQRMGFPIASCATEGCGVDGRRQAMKRLVQELAPTIHGLRGNILRALGNVSPEHLLDRDLVRRDIEEARGE